jgi:tetratricopeptide (TPR) repeat protein
MKLKLLIVSCAFIIVSCGNKKKTIVTPSPTKTDFSYIEKFHKAFRLKQMGQFANAISVYEECALMKPNDDAVYYALSQLYLQTNQLSKSSQAIQKAAKLDPTNKWYLQELAYMNFEQKNFKEAAKQFKILSENEPNNIEWLFSYAEALMRANDFTNAVKTLDKLENEVGLNPELSIEKFKLYRKIKQDNKAVEELTKALVIFPDDTQLLANLVDYYFEKREDEKAFSYLIKLAENDPTNGNAHLALAQYYDRKGNRNLSYSELNKAFVCDDVTIDTKLKIILNMYELQYKLDVEMYDLINILIEKNPNEARVYTVRGDFYLKDQKIQEALQDFKQALIYDQSKFIIWEQVLIMEYQNQDYASLYKISNNCLTFYPAIAKVYLFCGISAIQLKKHEEAIEKLTTGIDLVANDNPLKSEMHAQLGDAYFALKKTKEGKDNYEKALKLEPKNILFKNNYAYRLALENTDLDKAESLIQQVLENNPNEAHFIDTYGYVLFQQKKYTEALKQFEKALSLNLNDKHIVEHYGDALFKTGKVNEAINQWKKAKDLGATNLKLNDKINNKTYYDPEY